MAAPTTLDSSCESLDESTNSPAFSPSQLERRGHHPRQLHFSAGPLAADHREEGAIVPVENVDEYIAKHAEWKNELSRLREIVAASGMEETIKWGAPCYTLNGKNVVGMAAFKNYFGLWFHQGALLEDAEGVLINAQEGRTKALRQWRFASQKDLKARAIKKYVKEAMDLERSGQRIAPERNKALHVPPQLKSALGKNKKANKAFAALTPGRQREYANYIEEAKREETKEKRVQKILPMIESGVGLNDKYKNC